MVFITESKTEYEYQFYRNRPAPIQVAPSNVIVDDRIPSITTPGVWFAFGVRWRKEEAEEGGLNAALISCCPTPSLRWLMPIRRSLTFEPEGGDTMCSTHAWKSPGKS